jgi:hypothetical protein
MLQKWGRLLLASWEEQRALLTPRYAASLLLGTSRWGDAAARDGFFGVLLQQIGIALEADPTTLGGVAFGLTYGRPEPSIEAVAGAPAIKAATLTVTVDYESDAPLA